MPGPSLLHDVAMLTRPLMTISGTPPSLADIEALAARFEAAAIPSTEWKHETHLIMGAWHVARHGAESALERLRAGIRRLNAAHGTVDSDTRGYHETITRAYVRVIAAFLRVRAPDEALDAQRRRVARGSAGGAKSAPASLLAGAALLHRRASRLGGTGPRAASLAHPLAHP